MAMPLYAITAIAIISILPADAITPLAGYADDSLYTAIDDEYIAIDYDADYWLWLTWLLRHSLHCHIISISWAASRHIDWLH